MCIRDRSVWLITMEKLELAGGAWADEEGIWLPVASITQAWEEIAVATLPERAAVVAVSYTHLDVYKRQAQCRCGRVVWLHIGGD